MLTAAAWALVQARLTRPPRARLVVHEDLLTTFLDGEFVRTTSRVNLGTARGQRQTVEADRSDFSGASGVLSRPDGDPPFAWLVGRRPRIDLDVVQPADRVLTIRLATAVSTRQKATLRFNGVELGVRRLPEDGSLKSLKVDVPAELQRVGTNAVELVFKSTESRQLIGEPVPLPLAAFATTVSFRRPDDERGPAPVDAPGLQAVRREGRAGRRLVLPAATSARVGTRLPGGPRVVLRMHVERIDVPLEVSVVNDDGRRTPLATVPADARVPVELSHDLAPFAGQPVRLDLTTRGLRGEVQLKLAQILVPEPGDAAPATRPELPPDRSRPSFLVVVLDALARGHTSAHGFVRSTTPRLEQLARRNLTARRASAPASYTLASVGSLLTGQSPLTHGVVHTMGSRGAQRLDDEAPRLAAAMREGGYRTRALVTNPNASSRHGFATGFEEYVELFERPGLWDEGVTGSVLAPRLRGFLDEVGEAPFFAYVHVFEPHAPYRAPEAMTARFVRPYDGQVSGTRAWLDAFKTSEVPMQAQDWRHLRDLYAARVAWADRVLGRLLDALDQAGRADDTVVLVTSDHGEAFGEHGSVEHGDHVYAEQVDVPFVLAVPGRGRSAVKHPVTLEDVAPTLLDLAGLPVPEGMEGHNLLAGTRPPQRALFARSADLLPMLSWTRWPMRLVVDVSTRRRQLFDLAEDPHERHDLYEERPASAAWLYRELTRAVVEAEARRRMDLSDADAGLVEQLEALGYVQPADDAGIGAPLPKTSRILRTLLERF